MQLLDMFLPYQLSWLTDRSSNKLCLKSRRIGITYTSAFGVNETCLLYPKTDYSIFSRDEDLAGDFLKYLKPWVEVDNLVCGESLVCEGDIRAYQLSYPNGSRVRAYSSAPDRGVGKSGHSLLDEFQSHQNPDKLWGYVSPSRFWGGSVLIVGTMRGGTMFADMCADAEGPNLGGWSYHKITLDDALAQGLLRKVNAHRRATGLSEFKSDTEFKNDLFKGLSPEAVRQEYYCEAVEKVYRVFGEDVVVRQTVEAKTMFSMPHQKKGLCYLGMDIGRIHDHSVICVAESCGGKLYIRVLKSFNQTEFSKLREELKAHIGAWTPEKIVIDASTIGIELAEWAVSMWGENNVVPATITGLSKEKIIVHTVALLEGQSLFIPDVPGLKQQFLSIHKKVTPESFVRYVMPTTAGGHCDEAMAVMLACYGASGNPGELMAQRLQKQEIPSKGVKRQMSHRQAYDHPGDE